MTRGLHMNQTCILVAPVLNDHMCKVGWNFTMSAMKQTLINKMLIFAYLSLSAVFI